MDRTDLELVLCVQQHGSMAAAAVQLGITRSAVTRRLAALEAHLGVRLFQRTTRRVSTTAEGDAFCERAQRLQHDFLALEAELRERQAEPAGPIRLLSSFGFGRRWVGPALADFQSLHPGVSVQLQLSDHLPDLAAEGFDAAVWLWHPPPQRAGEWVARRLAPNRRVLVAAPAYLQVHGRPARLEDLEQHRCLLVQEHTDAMPARVHHWALQREGDETIQRVVVRGPLSSNSGELVRDWCVAGHGIMLRSLWDIAPQLGNGELFRVLPRWSQHDADVHWLAPWRARVPRRVQLLSEFLQKRFVREPWRPRSRS